MSGIRDALTLAAKDGEMVKSIVTNVKLSVQQGKGKLRPIQRKLNSIIKLLKKYNMPDFAKGLEKFNSFISNIKNKIFSIKGWKGMLASFGLYMGMRYVDEKWKILKKLQSFYNILEDPKAFLKSLIDEKVIETKEAAEEKIGETVDEIKDWLMEKVKNSEFVKKMFSFLEEKIGFLQEVKEKISDVVKKIASEAVAQLAGPIAWIKNAIEIFGKAEYVVNAMAPILANAKEITSSSRPSQGVDPVLHQLN